MTKPSALPEWNETQVNLTIPDATHKAQGWLKPAGVPEKPPLETFNYWMNNVYRWLKAINDLGVLDYDNATDYVLGSFAVGSNAILYKCRLANGPSTSVVNPVNDVTGTWTSLEWDAANVKRSIFSYNNTTTFKINGGSYLHIGTTRKEILKVIAELTYTVTSPGTSQWQYLYIDDSALGTSNILVAGSFINSTTAPTYDAIKGGWYNGTDQCLFAVKINSSGEIIHFTHDGGEYVSWAGNNSGLDPSIGDSTPSNSYTDVGFASGMPAFSTQGQAIFNATYVDATALLQWRTKGTSLSGRSIVATGPGVTREYTSFIIGTNSSQQIEVKFSTTTTNSFEAALAGWKFPVGM